MPKFNVHFIGSIQVEAAEINQAMPTAMRILGMEDDIFDLIGITNVEPVDSNSQLNGAIATGAK